VNAGGLGALSAINVSTDVGATAALGTIETLIDTAISAAASFGSVQGRIDIQSEYVSSLTDSLKSGIGSLVDADMEETSARLQALQVQQQLGIQALSIANQAPQNILSLFR
jgi:flagellin